MAQLVLGLGSSHSAQLRIPWEFWHLGGEKDMVDRRFDYQELLKSVRPGMESEVTPEKFRERYEACLRGMATIKEAIQRVSPDVIVMLGDDQKEQFNDDNMPMLCIYNGESMPVRSRRRADRNRGDRPPNSGGSASPQRNWLSEQVRADTAPEYPGSPDLANHLLRQLVQEEFDVSRSNQLKPDIGLGHAFTYLYQLWPECNIPVVPFMVNTYYPPNTPTPRRCYALGQALRRAIESWDPGKRVAVMASGGLSHQIIDEEIDELTIKGLREKDPEILCGLPEERLTLGTSEIRNWIIAAGATETMELGYLEYLPCFRSLAGTGCAMGFAVWE